MAAATAMREYAQGQGLVEELTAAMKTVLIEKPANAKARFVELLTEKDAPPGTADTWSEPGKAVDDVGIPGGGKRLLLVARPQGDFKDSDFKVVEEPIPEPAAGQAVVQNIYVSVDPTHRIWASDKPQYMPAVGLGTVMRAGCVGKVVKTSDPEKMAVGTYVSLFGGVQEYACVPIATLNPVVSDVPLTYNHSVLSVVIGHTAWLGTNICKPKAGETMVVSGAAGAVGSIAAQLAKKRGAKVIGIAGGATKCAWLRDELCLDGVIDYKSDDLDAKLDELCPEGVDCFFDNVGGVTLETLLTKMRNFGRVAFCGAISAYTDENEPTVMNVKNYQMILMRRLTVQGFICVDHVDQFGTALGELIPMVMAGELKINEDVREVGVENFPSVVNDLYAGKNTGKLMLKINPE